MFNNNIVLLALFVVILTACFGVYSFLKLLFFVVSRQIKDKIEFDKHNFPVFFINRNRYRVVIKVFCKTEEQKTWTVALNKDSGSFNSKTVRIPAGDYMVNFLKDEDAEPYCQTNLTVTEFVSTRDGFFGYHGYVNVPRNI